MPDELERLGAMVVYSQLRYGDYDLGSGVRVERKQIRDLHLTLVNGRYWRQIGNLRREASWPVLLIEGDLLADGPVTTEAIRGVYLATIEQSVSVIRSSDASDSAAWLWRLALRVQRRRHRHRPRFAQLPQAPPDDVATAMLAAVPGISSVTARSLLCAFGGVSGVVAATVDEWREVPGMGERRCAALARALGATPSTSPSRSEGPDPST